MRSGVLLALSCAVWLAGCAAPARSTRLTAGDMEETAGVMAGKLAASSFLSGRTGDSEPVVIAIDRVENLTSDVIPASEQWWLMERLRDAATLQSFARDRNIRFVIPAEHLREGRERGNLPREFGAERAPTHQMSATFRSATRSADRSRTEVYLLDCRITEVGTGALAWSDGIVLKREAFGKSYD